jgi:hypothetical protein
MATAVLPSATDLVRRSSKRNVNGSVRNGSNLSDTARDAATGLTSYVGDANLDWEPKGETDEAAPKQRSLSFRRVIRTSSFRKKTQVSDASPVSSIALAPAHHRSARPLLSQVKLPKNWSRIQEENGSVYFLNSVTNQRSVEVCLARSGQRMFSTSRSLLSVLTTSPPHVTADAC